MSRTTSDRLAVKTLGQRFRYELETAFEVAPRIAQGILEAAKSAFSLDAVTGHQNGRLRPGQIRQLIAAAVGAPHPLRDTEEVEVLTASEDRGHPPVPTTTPAIELGETALGQESE